MRKITVSELCRRQEAGDHLLLADLRSYDDYARAHIPGAICVSAGQLELLLKEEDDPIILIMPNASQMTDDYLIPMQGRGQFLVLEGGTESWIGSGRDAVGGAHPAWSIERQVRLIAGTLLLITSFLALAVNPAWIYVPMLIGFSLFVAGSTGFCTVARILQHMPWNKPTQLRRTNPRSGQPIAH